MSWRGRSFWSAYSAPKKVVAGAGRQFGEQIPDFGQVFGRAALIDHIGQEPAKLVDLEQRGRLADQRGDQPGAGCEPLAAEMMRRGRPRTRISLMALRA